MKRYFTAQEFNDENMDWLMKDKDDDKWGRYLTDKLFETYKDKFFKPIDHTEQNLVETVDEGDNYYDIMLYFEDGDQIAVECKYRYDTSYETHFCNTNKFYLFKKRRKENIIQGGQLITCWPNGKIFVSNIFKDSNRTTEEHMQNITTNADSRTDRKKTLKKGEYFKPDNIFYYAYIYEPTSDIKWKPIFSKDPIDVKSLEENYKKSVSLF